MKRFLLSISLLFCAVTCFSQWTIQSIGGPKTFVVARGPIGSDSTIVFRGSFNDTSAANNGQIETLAGAVIRVTNELWMRNSTATEWLPIGGQAVAVDNSNTVTLSGTGGTEDPIIANVILSSQAGNIIQQFADGLFVPNSISNGIISGGFRTWVSGYTYDITEVVYAIGGVVYTAPETQVTLANADPSLNRLDLIVSTTSNTITTITGTPATDPALPSYNPLTQIPLGFVLVTAGSTQPSGVNQDYIYLNNAEWTTSSSTPRVNAASANNPFSPPLDIEFTLARNNDSITFTDPTQPTNMANFKFLTMKLRSKAAWPATARLTFRFFNDGVAQGNLVSMGNGNFGLNTANTSGYQTITMPKELFGNLTNVDLLFITVVTQGGQTIGLYLDDIQLQGGTGTGSPTSGHFWIVGGNLEGSQLVGGTLDDNLVQFIANNLNHTQLMTNGGVWRQGSTALTSYLLGTFASSDYYDGRTGTDMLVHSAGSITHKVVGNNIYTYNTTDGHLWYTSGATPRMELDATGNLNLGSTVGSTNAILNVVSTTKSSHFAPSMTSTEMTNIVTPKTGSAVFNSTANLHYWYNGSAWVPLGGVTADNGLTMSTATNVQLGGTLLANTTITATGLNLTIDGTTSFGSLYVKGTTGTAFVAEATGTGHALNALTANDNGWPLQTFKNTSSTNTVLGGVVIQRATTGTAGDGIGGYLQFSNEIDNGSINISNKIISKWTTVANLTRKSQLIITGVHNAAEADLLTISSTGATRLNSYGVGAFTGTTAYLLGVDASGNIIETAAAGGAITANNGLTMSTATNAQLGGTLVANTTVATTTGFSLQISGDVPVASGNGTLIVANNSVDGSGIYASANTAIAIQTLGGSYGVYSTAAGVGGVGVRGNSGSGASAVGVFGSTTDGIALSGLSSNSDQTSVLTALRLTRSVSIGGSDGIGQKIAYTAAVSTGISQTSNELISIWSTANSATRVSRFTITGVDNAVTGDKFILNGNGSVQLPDYGINTFAGVAAYVLGVDASGNVVEVAAAGAGMTNVLTTTGDIIYSSSGTTPARLGIGTSGQLLRVSAGGIPEWATIVGTGSVTDVSWTGGIVSIATSTTTPAFTIAGTSGGIPYFSSSSTWASSAALAANAIVIGGGAGAAPSTTTTGTGVLTALGVNTGSAGAFVVNGGALGTPSSGVATNLTGTATALNIGGNAATATILQTARTINGTSFDGSTNITVTAAAGTLTGTTLNATVVTSSLTSVGTIGTGVWQGTAITDGFIASAATWNGKQAGDATLTALAGLTITNGSLIVGTGADAFSVLAMGSANQVLRVNSGATGLEWASVGSGTVTSVAMSVPSFLSVSGSPITGAGTFAVTLSGTALPIANGGTGLTADGAANEILGVEADGSGLEYKAFTGSNGITVTHSVGGVAISNTFNPTVQTLTDGATITWNVTNGGNAVVTLASTGRTLSITNPVAGYTYTIRIIQGSGGSKTITTWPTGTRWEGGTAPTLSTIAGDMDVIVLYYDGSNYYGSYGLDFG